MNNLTALAFNSKISETRLPDQDTFNYFAICNDNINNYVGTKRPNYFMGPTFYDTDVVNKVGRKNTVNRLGEDCGDKPYDECFFCMLTCYTRHLPALVSPTIPRRRRPTEVSSGHLILPATI